MLFLESHLKCPRGWFFFLLFLIIYMTSAISLLHYLFFFVINIWLVIQKNLYRESHAMKRHKNMRRSIHVCFIFRLLSTVSEIFRQRQRTTEFLYLNKSIFVVCGVPFCLTQHYFSLFWPMMHFNKIPSGMAGKSDFILNQNLQAIKLSWPLTNAESSIKLAATRGFFYILNDFKNTETDFIKSCKAELSALIAGVLKRL